jgi:antitoxin Phd
MNVSATELKARLGRYLEIVAKEPVFIEKNGRNTAVIISTEEYQKFISLDDMYWGALAMQAKQEGVYQGDAMQRILDMAQQKGIKLESA